MPLEVREDLLAGRAMTGTLGAFAIKVAQNPTSIGTEHVHALKRAGHSEDAIFECIVAAALGAALERLQAGLDAVAGESGATR